MVANFFGVLGKTDYFNFGDRKIPLHEVLDKYLQPDGWLAAISQKQQLIPINKPRIFESGAWGYREQDSPTIRGQKVTPSFALEEYRKRFAHYGDLVLAPDHLLTNCPQNKDRVTFNYHSAKTFLALAPQILPKCTPAAVIHGEDLKQRIQRTQELYEQGYRALAIGGLVPFANSKDYVFQTVKAIRKQLPDCYLHVLGLSSPDFAHYWHLLEINSFDGSTYIQTALRGNEFLLALGHKLHAYSAVSPGKESPAPACYCPVCQRLALEGFDPRTTGSRQSSLGRVAHNLGQLIIAQFARVIPRNISLIAGVGQKLDRPAPVRDLYCSQWWILAKNYCDGHRCEWRAVSARFGLLHPDHILAPYEENPHDKPRDKQLEWSRKVVKQLVKLAPAGSTFVFLGGNKYREHIIPALNSATLNKKYLTLTPIAGLGIGQQKQWLKTMTPSYVQLSIL